ncbi:MAG: c-type cytochrome [Cyclobacteriaceae bacterium]
MILIGLGLAFIAIRGIPSYPVKAINYRANPTPEKLARGKVLVSTLCAGCHMNTDTRTLTGQRMLDVPAEFGTIYSPNITQDRTYGIGEWTDGEILYLLRTGIKRDGQYAPPYMAKLPTMADNDIASIIAFLRSDDPLVAPDPTPDQPVEPSFLVKLLSAVAFKPLPYPEQPIPMPDTTNMVELGKYYAHNLDCFSCHSADFKTNNFLEPVKSVGYFGGGLSLLNKKGQSIVAQNLTPDKKSGIGNWTEEQFVKAVKYGMKDGEEALRYPMLPYVHLTDQEIGSIYHYLMTIPAIENQIERSTLE